MFHALSIAANVPQLPLRILHVMLANVILVFTKMEPVERVMRLCRRRLMTANIRLKTNYKIVLRVAKTVTITARPLMLLIYVLNATIFTSLLHRTLCVYLV